MKRLLFFVLTAFCVISATEAADSRLDFGYRASQGEMGGAYVIVGMDFPVGAGFSFGPEASGGAVHEQSGDVGLCGTYSLPLKWWRLSPALSASYLWPVEDDPGFDQRYGIVTAFLTGKLSEKITLRGGYRSLIYPDAPKGAHQRDTLFVGLALGQR